MGPPSTASAPTPPRAASSRTTPRSARPTCARPTMRPAASTALATAPRRAASPTRRTAPRPATTRSYFCKDKAGNKDCDWKKGTKVYRRVFVKDTLPPVITLHLRNKLIAAGNGKQKGVNGVMNPAGTAAGNPNIKYMAEETTSSVNGWIVGALASAVTGLALLGYSLRKSDNVVTSVPV